MRITGVVKGTEQDAIVAANKHGLQIKVLHVLADSVTIEFVNELWEMRIQRWFAESPIVAPFPAGTLLLYSYHGNGPLPSEQWVLDQPQTLEKWLELNCPDVSADIKANGCWDYKIFSADGESLNRVVIHISTGKTARIKTYMIAASTVVSGVTWSVIPKE